MKIINVFKHNRFWTAEDGNFNRGIVRGPEKKWVLSKAVERAQKEKCSKVIVFCEEGKSYEKWINREC